MRYLTRKIEQYCKNNNKFLISENVDGKEAESVYIFERQYINNVIRFDIYSLIL
jgi:hypothetical protein